VGRADYLKKGANNVICDMCGFKYKNTDCRFQWNNMFVCSTCFEERNPQDFVKGIADTQRVPVSRPDRAPIFINRQITPDDL